jgi:phosphomevalonate kinase
VSRARAPGKVVLSGAYAVLSGTPALVIAVERDVVADTARPAEFLTEEVKAALDDAEQAPFFDASALREDGRKLGLGSSAAILVASLFALEQARTPAATEAELRERVFARALPAHRRAQGGGSGIDVASSTFGGVLLYRLAPGAPQITPATLPPALAFEVWVCPSSASTPELIGKVTALAARSPDLHARCLGAQASASVAAEAAVLAGDAPGLLAALAGQYRALLALGHAAQAPIVTAELADCAPLAEREGGVLLPAGAGGGDIALFVGQTRSSQALRSALEQSGHRLLAVGLAARGASAC